MANTAILRRAQALPFQKMKDETLVVDPKSREVHLLNPTASRIWELLEQGATVPQLVATLSDEYDVDVAVLKKQVAAFAQEMVAKKLLVGP